MLRVGKIDMGRFLATLVWSPDLNRVVTLEHFHISGNLLVRIDRFSNLVTDEHIEKEAHFSSLALILSKPIALLGLREHNCCKPKDSSISFKQKDTDPDFFRLRKV